MQELINEYFSKICENKFFKNDDEIIIGKAKDVIENLIQQLEYVKEPKNKVKKEDVEFITDEVKELIKEIKSTYSNENDVIKIQVHPMAGFYVLKEQESLLEDLEQYYKEMK